MVAMHGVGMPPGVWIPLVEERQWQWGRDWKHFAPRPLDIQHMVMEAAGDRPIGLAIYALF